MGNSLSTKLAEQQLAYSLSSVPISAVASALPDFLGDLLQLPTHSSSDSQQQQQQQQQQPKLHAKARVDSAISISSSNVAQSSLISTTGGSLASDVADSDRDQCTNNYLSGACSINIRHMLQAALIEEREQSVSAASNISGSGGVRGKLVALVNGDIQRLQRHFQQLVVNGRLPSDLSILALLLRLAYPNSLRSHGKYSIGEADDADDNGENEDDEEEQEMISDTIEALQHSLVPGFGSTRTQERQRRALELFARSHTFSETTNEHAEASAPASASASAGSLNCLIPITFRDVAYIQTSHGLSLANHGIVAISPAIAHAADILTRLDLSHNLLASLPSEIGCLVNLRAISLSHNRLRTFPDSIRQLTKLTEIHASYNELTSLPSCIGVLRSLVLLDLAHNQITDLPGSIRGLTSLINLRISFNPLRALPAEIAMLTQIRTIHAEGCPFHKVLPGAANIDQQRAAILERAIAEGEIITSDSPSAIARAGKARAMWNHHTTNEVAPSSTVSKTPELDEHGMEAVPVPSLRELAARTIINNRLDVSTALSPPLQRLLRSAQQCSVCGGPYIETCVRRYRMIVRDNPNPPQPTPLNANGNPDMSALQQSIPLEYRMCWNHWSSDGDRIVSMFQTKRRPASSTIDSIRHTASTTNHQQASRPSRLRSLGKSLSSIISGSHRGSKRRSESVDALVAAVSLTDAIAPYSAPTAPPLVSIDALTTEDAFDSVGLHSSANEVVEAATALILTMSPTIAPSAPFIMHEESLSSQSDDAIIQVPQITVQSTGNESTMSTLKPRQPHQQHRRHFSRNRRISFSAKDALQPASLPAISPPTVAPSTSISAPLDLTSLSSSTEQRWSALHDDSGLMVVESGVPLETIDSAVLMPSLDLQDITADGVESLDDALERVQLYPAVTISTSPIAL